MSTKQPDHVFLVHEVGLDSVLHLSMGLIGFHTIPFRHRWYVTLLMPITIPIMLAMWAFATPFYACEHHIDDIFAQTWVMPRFGFQVNIEANHCDCFPSCCPNSFFLCYTIGNFLRRTRLSLCRNRDICYFGDSCNFGSSRSLPIGLWCISDHKSHIVRFSASFWQFQVCQNNECLRKASK